MRFFSIGAVEIWVVESIQFHDLVRQAVDVFRQSWVWWWNSCSSFSAMRDYSFGCKSGPIPLTIATLGRRRRVLHEIQWLPFAKLSIIGRADEAIQRSGGWGQEIWKGPELCTVLFDSRDIRPLPFSADDACFSSSSDRCSFAGRGGEGESKLSTSCLWGTKAVQPYAKL